MNINELEELAKEWDRFDEGNEHSQSFLELIAAYREAVAALIRIERGTDGVTQPYKWFSSLDIKEIAKEPIDTAKRLGVE